jgi:hypothetical protein
MLLVPVGIVLSSVVLAAHAATAAATGAAAAPRSYYISPSGSDANPGTLQKPWKTTQPFGASLAANPGDRVLFEGEPAEHLGVGLTVTRGGSAAMPLAIGSYGGSSGFATLVGGSLVLDGASHVDARGLFLVGNAAPGAASARSSGVYLLCGNHTAPRRCVGVSLTDITVKAFGVGVNIYGQGGGGFDGLSLLRVHATENIRQGISSSGPYPRNAGAYAHRNMSIANCTASHNLGDSTVTKSHTGSGIVLSNVDGATVSWCSAHSNGWLQASAGGGPVGIWAWEARSVAISHSAAWNNSNGLGLHDGGGFDLDGGVTDSGKKTHHLLRHLCIKNDDFTKTGSGQTKGKHSKRDAFSYSD